MCCSWQQQRWLYTGMILQCVRVRLQLVVAAVLLEHFIMCLTVTIEDCLNIPLINEHLLYVRVFV